MITLNTSFMNALTIGVFPFVLGDVLKAILAMGIALKLK